MKDVCWIHYKEYELGKQCPDCLKREQEYKQSLLEYDSSKEKQPGHRIWRVIKLLLWINIALWVLTVLIAMLIAG
jgi:hypothetical protein